MNDYDNFVGNLLRLRYTCYMCLQCTVSKQNNVQYYQELCIDLSNY